MYKKCIHNNMLAHILKIQSTILVHVVIKSQSFQIQTITMSHPYQSLAGPKPLVSSWYGSLHQSIASSQQVQASSHQLRLNAAQLCFLQEQQARRTQLGTTERLGERVVQVETSHQELANVKVRS